ncbi:MAG TPA: DNA polymerase I [Phycisphaerae bacterium]|nr:DNA polymerase I [Phycisphaerae bacterium]
MSRSFYIIDGHAQIYRAYHARVGELTAPSGEPTRATYVFCQMLLNLIRDRQPDYLAMAMDVSDETVFRKEIYPEYKANREPPPEDMAVQIDRIVSILEAAGIPILRKERFEADDILATLTRRFDDPGLHIYLVSRDKDLDQLLCERVSLYDPVKDEVITPQRLFELKGWRTDQAIEAQILVGDSTDNVPGVRLIGEKKAAALLAKYGSAKAVVEHADELTPKQCENVKAFAPRVEMVRQLVTLRDDVPLEFQLEQGACARFDWKAVRPIFDELGFRRLTEQLSTMAPDGGSAVRTAEGPAVAAQGATESAYRLVNTPKAFDELVSRLAGQKDFALDTETTSVNPTDAELVGLSFAWEAGRGCYIPVRSVYGETLPLERVRDALGPILADETKRKVGQNLKYDLIVLRYAGMPVAGPLFDTMIAAFVLDPAQSSYKLDKLVRTHLGHEMIPISELIGKGRQQLQMDQVPLERVTEYAAEDADYTWRLKELFEPRLKSSDRGPLFFETEMPLVSVLTDMEYEGISLDVEFLRGMGRDMAVRVDAITDEVHRLVGTPFNLDSPKQLGEILFDKLGYRVVRKTKTARSTDAETLEVLAAETGDPLPTRLLEYRELQKLRGTYLEALPNALSRRTGRIHTSYHQTGAVTGRLSSSEPNLQNIPVRTELGRQIRRAFVPRGRDEVLIIADYSQIELRVLAHFCQDEALLEAFAADRDIHAFVAAQVNGVPLEAVTKEMRGRAKAVNFGIIYGQSAFGLSRTTGMSRTEAKAFIDDYFRRYPRIRGFLDQCIEDAKRDGYVRTILGRRRPIPNIDSRNHTVRAQAERLAVNTVIQGSAADLIKTAMIQLHRRIRQERLALRMLLQVHDELVCEAPRKQAPHLSEAIADVMSHAMGLRVPLKVDVHTGENWLEAK